MSTFLSRITLDSPVMDTSLSKSPGTPSVTSFTQGLPHPPPSHQLVSLSNPMSFSNRLTRLGDQQLQLSIRSSRIFPTYCPPVNLPLNTSAHLLAHVFVVFVDRRLHPPLGRRLIYPQLLYSTHSNVNALSFRRGSKPCSWIMSSDWRRQNEMELMVGDAAVWTGQHRQWVECENVVKLERRVGLMYIQGADIRYPITGIDSSDLW